jgi:hypothetical protein
VRNGTIRAVGGLGIDAQAYSVFEDLTVLEAGFASDGVVEIRPSIRSRSPAASTSIERSVSVRDARDAGAACAHRTRPPDARC